MYAGEGNVKIHCPSQNASINLTGWTCTLIVTKPDGTAASGSPYTLTVSADGSEAYYITVGTEFPVPGEYTFEFHALAPGATHPNISRVLVVIS